MITYYMGFFKYEDSTIWQKTSLHRDKSELSDYLSKLAYVKKDSIVIKDIELPD